MTQINQENRINQTNEANDNDIDILHNLNPDQREAVLYFDSPLLVIAGAGSGKTRVITNKIAYLVKEKGFSPWNILGVTFTNKAANEMKARIQSLTGIEARHFNISTFHSLGLRILRESGASAGFDGQWQVMDDADQRKILEQIIKKGFSFYTRDMREQVKRKIGSAKMELNYPNNKEFLYQKGFSDDEVTIYSRYYNYQKENKLWDYEDLISFPVKLLQADDGLREKYAQRFRYVVVDEFQDTNPNQYELLTSIAVKHRNITVVGDDDQAVYSWRGASIRFLFNFENDFPGSHIIKLEQNYRSTPQVLEFANNVITRNSQRRPKAMWTGQDAGNPVMVIESRTKEDEARMAADLVLRLRETAPDLFPLAVLYRINSQSLAFETEFTRRGIDFKILKGLRFFDRKEIKDSLALLKLAVNPDDDIAFMRMTDFLSMGIGAKTMDSLSRLAQKNGNSLFRTLKEHAPEKFASRELFSFIDKANRRLEESRESGEADLADMLKRLLNVSGYPDALETKGEQSRLLNIDELIAFIGNWQKTTPGGAFGELLDHICLEAGENDNKGNNTNNADTRVFLLTMHNAKGLEFPTVLAVGINSGYMPFFLRKDRVEIEEERRLFYVAATRAIKQLVISPGSERKSPFLLGVRRALYSTAYSVDDLVGRIAPETGPSSGRGLSGGIYAAADIPEERYIDHPVFGRGKIINAIDEVRYIVEFVDRGEKTIDTSIVPVTFL